ncbi:methylcytosine dioxygenase TET [Culicoides brevitarsis]|uniref:methylcytosine dioxygenase TET n=1 Tax=Culicoides brevitarsis TaxID=469753 RepID=UPI00307BE19E
MKDQSQQPMTPMAFYPTWQADPTQGWQNQFIQQIPQNTPTIAPLGSSLDFQPQGYAYQANSYVQTGLGFDPNYGRPTYASPNYMSNQLPLSNQVSLQSVNFAPTVTYAGQVSSGPALLLGSGQNGAETQKQLSGNDMPGYPRVSNVPQRSLNCNGYPGSEYSGTQTQSTPQNSNSNSATSQSSSASMQPPSASMTSSSPSRSRPNSNQQIYSPSHLNANMSTYSSSPSHTTTPAMSYGSQDNQNGQSPGSNGNSGDWAWNNGMSQGQQEMFNQSDRVNLNTRLKTMILNKETQDDPKLGGNDQSQAQTGHFLSYSHHLRDTPNSSMNDNNTTVPAPDASNVDSFGRGGISETWKFGNPEFPAKTSSNKKQDFEQKQQSIEKSIEDSRRENAERYASSPYYGSTSSKSNNNSSNDKMQPQKNKSPNKNPSYSSKSSHDKVKRETFDPYDFDANRSVKQESDAARPEAFEKNYQSFIKYSDFVENQQSQTQTQQQSTSAPSVDPKLESQPNYYLPSYGNYSGFQPYPTYSQGYTNLTPQNSYTPQETPGINQSSNSAFMATNQQQSTTTATTTTNFEQQIPAHTYPKIIGATTNTSSAAAKSDNGELSQDSGTLTPKIEPEYSSEFSQGETGTPVNEGQSTSQSSESENAANVEKVDVKKEGKEEKPKKVKKEANAEAGDAPAKPKPKRVRNKKKKEDKNKDKDDKPSDPKPEEKKEIVETKAMKKAKDPLSIKPELPNCDCFKDEKAPPEPGSYYTHLGCAATLADLRKEIEQRVGITGKQLRIEKVVYTGKEGKSSQGCPIAKWVIRRVDPEEKLLYIVKNRKGHRCKASWLVISIVVWDGVPPHEADSVYRMLIHKLNKFGLPTTRRCATNENRTCACQGLDPETCGVSYSFGCSWSMYYNGCKYARSKTVRKFRLSVKNEEAEIEERMNILATMLAPIYSMVAPKSYENQTQHEREAYDCRLGLKQGKPFSGVTCCLDFCAHTHRDLHNMQDGCTVQAILLKPRPYGMPPDDEQLHVLPMYTMDTTDEFDDEEAQKKKNETGACKLLDKFPTEVRVRSTPLQPCRRHGKKRNNGKDDDESLADEISEPPMPEPKVDNKKEKRSKKDKDNLKAPSTPTTPGTPTTKVNPSSNSSMSPRAGTPNSLSNNSNSNSAFTTPPSSVQQPAGATQQSSQQQQGQQQGQQQQKPPGSTSLIDMASMIDNFTDAQLQSNQISSTVLDSPYAAYDYNLGTYVDTRTYYNQWPDYGYANRKPEEIPDTTTRPGSNSSNSAFSPSISEPKTPTNFTNLEDFKPGFHQTERGFVKPKPPDYHTGYGYHTPGYPNPTYPYSPYESPYNSYNYNYTQSYQPYSYTPGPMPPPGPTSVPTPPNWSLYPHANPAAAVSNPVPIMKAPEAPKETLGEIKEINDNLDCFEETQMGGVAIALQHGSLVIECAKLEMHSTTALKHPNRLNPTRMSLIFYQHRNLNRRAHGTAEWAEKMRLKKLGLSAGDEEMLMMDDDIKDEPLDDFDDPEAHWGSNRMSQKKSMPPSMTQKPMLNKVVNHQNTSSSSSDIRYHHPHHSHHHQHTTTAHHPPSHHLSHQGTVPPANNHHMMQQSHIPAGYQQHHASHHQLHGAGSGLGNHHHFAGSGGSDRSTLTRTTTSWTTQFPMHPCITTGPYYDSQAAAAAMGLALDPNMPPPPT